MAIAAATLTESTRINRPATNSVPILPSTFDASANTNMAVYWGQGFNQKRLKHFCEDSNVDIISIGFVNQFPDQTRGYPGTNFGNQCGQETYNNPDGTPSPLLSNCPHIGPDVKFCQAMGKKILLSLGGAYPTNQHIESQDSANDFADFLWRAFGPDKELPGSTFPRPFGDASIDGFDLDIESSLVEAQPHGAPNDPYGHLVKRFRQHYKQEPTTYYISGAPQCIVPDANLAEAIKQADFDFLFVQFYNTPICSARAYFDHSYGASNGDDSNISFDQWVDFVHNARSNAKVFLGLPAAPHIAYDSTMYLEPSEALQIIEHFQGKFPNDFGGVMVYEATASEDNAINNEPYADKLKKGLKNGSSANGSPSVQSTSLSDIRTGTAPPINTGSGSYPNKTGKYPTGGSSGFVASTGLPIRPSGSGRSYPLSSGRNGLPIKPSDSVRSFSQSTSGTGIPTKPSGSIRSYPLSTGGTGMPTKPASSVKSYPLSTGGTSVSTKPSGSVRSYPLSAGGTGIPVRPSGSVRSYLHSTGGTGLPIRSSGSVRSHPQSTGATGLLRYPSGSVQSYPQSTGGTGLPIYSTGSVRNHPQSTGGTGLPLHLSESVQSHPQSIKAARPFSAPSSGLSPSTGLPTKPSGSSIPNPSIKPTHSTNVTSASRPIGSVPTSIKLGGSAPHPLSSHNTPFLEPSAKPMYSTNATSTVRPSESVSISMSTGGNAPHLPSSGTASFTIQSASRTAHTTVQTGTSDKLSSQGSSQVTSGHFGPSSRLFPTSSSALSRFSFSSTPASSKGPFHFTNSSIPVFSIGQTPSIAAPSIDQTSSMNAPSSQEIPSLTKTTTQESPVSIASKPGSPALTSSPASTQEVVTTEFLTSYLTTCPVTHTATSGGSTVLQFSQTVSTVYSTITSTICTKCVPPPTPTPAASSQGIITTVIVYTTVTTCPVTNTITSGSSQVLQFTSTVLTVTGSVTSTICTKCITSPTNAPAPGVPALHGPEHTQPSGPVYGSSPKNSSPSNPSPGNPSSASQNPSNEESTPGSSPSPKGSVSGSQGQQAPGSTISAPDAEKSQAQGEQALGASSPAQSSEKSPAQGKETPAANSQAPVTNDQSPAINGPAAAADSKQPKIVTIAQTVVPVPLYPSQTEQPSVALPPSSATAPSPVNNVPTAAADSKQPKIVTIAQTVVPVPLYPSQTERPFAALTSSPAILPFPINNATAPGPSATGLSASRISAQASSSPVAFTGAANKVGSGFFGVVAGLVMALMNL
ncbi:MAG: hypothetical protein Q9217_001716 [Psora testacea]